MAYKMIIAAFGGYIFRRKGEDGNYYVQADKEQQRAIKKMGISLIPVEDD